MFNLNQKSMKKLTFIILAVAAMAAVSTSCKKDTKASPVIAFSNIADSASSYVAAGDNYDLTINITSEAGLKKVVVSENKNGTKTDKLTVEKFDDNAAYTKVYTVTGIGTGITVIISATDKDDQNTTREILITKPVAAALTTVTFSKTIGAYGSATLGSYIDLDGGGVYLKSELTGNLGKIDAVFNLSTLMNTGDGVTSTGTTFGTTTLNATTFASANVDALTGLSADQNTIVIEQGDVVYFENATKKGLILIKTYTVVATNKDEITIEVKLTSK